MGELPSPILPDEILVDGPDRVRALVVVGANPVASFPQQDKIVRALRELELLVVVEPFPTETARLAHYVVAPTLSLERPDHTGYFEGVLREPFAQYTDAVVQRPEGVVDDWEFFVDLAAAMDMPIKVAGRWLQPDEPRPSSEEVLGWIAERGRVPLAEVRRHPHGMLVDDVEPLTVRPDDGSGGQFQLLADDVREELAEALAEAGALPRPDRPWQLVVRRQREVMNSLGRRIEGLPPHRYNPCHAHPDDLAALGAAAGDLIRITSDHGSVLAVCAGDRSMRPGTVALTHGYGDLSEDADPLLVGASAGRLLSLETDLQAISAMPRMSAVPVQLERLAAGPV